MGFFKMRSRRITVEIPVKIFLQEKKTERISPEYQAGTMINLSKDGACVILQKVSLNNGDHLFFSAQKQDSKSLCIEVFENNETVTQVLADAILMDSITYQDKAYFKIGVQFTEEQKELFTYYKRISP